MGGKPRKREREGQEKNRIKKMEGGRVKMMVWEDTELASPHN